jgi:hypothetical protein
MNTDLPSHCERRVTSDGNIFFINHNTQKTHWLHPTIEEQLLPENVSDI